MSTYRGQPDLSYRMSAHSGIRSVSLGILPTGHPGRRLKDCTGAYFIAAWGVLSLLETPLLFECSLTLIRVEV